MAVYIINMIRLLKIHYFKNFRWGKGIWLLLLLRGILVPFEPCLWAESQNLQGHLTVAGAWAIYPTVVAWAEAFQKIHPNVKIDVSAGGAGKGVADVIAGLADIGMVSREPDPAELQKDIRAVYILKDAVFPIVSENNPAILDLLKIGLKRSVLKEIYVTGTMTRWNQAITPGAQKPIHIYTRSDASGAAASWANYLGAKQEDLRGIGVYGDPGLLEATRRDPLAIGYTNFSFVFIRQGTVVPGIRLLSIDANENGLADPKEVYENRQQTLAAIEAGHYPLARKDYLFIKKTTTSLVKEFIRFALSQEGTEIVGEVGASLPLTQKEREKVVESVLP